MFYKSVSWLDFTYQLLAPCGVNDFVCGKAGEWVSNGTELCRAAGFAIKPLDDVYIGAEETSCYGGKGSLEAISNSWRASQSDLPQKAENLGVLQDFHQWVHEMPFSEKVSWAVGGMVLTAGLLFMRLDHSLVAFYILPRFYSLLFSFHFIFIENKEFVKR